MSPASKLIKKHMPKIISDIEENHLKPYGIELAKGVADGFYSARQKRIIEKEGE